MTKGSHFRAVISQAEHPSLSNRKRIRAWALIERNFRIRAVLEKVERNKQLDSLIARLLAAADSPAFLDDEVSLEKYMQRLDAATISIVQEDTVSDAKILALVSHFRRELPISCADCASRVNAVPCNGSLQDERIIKAGMHCWDFATGLFAFLVEIAEASYQIVLPIVPKSALQIELHTRAASSERFRGETKYHGDTGARRHAQVIVDFPTDMLATRRLEALPNLMFHEIFIHAPEALLSEAKRDIPTPETCSLREGYMDAAANDLLIAVLTRTPHRIPGFYQEFAEQIAESSKDAHCARLDNTGYELYKNDDGARNTSIVIERRRDGQKAFNAVSKVLGLEIACVIGMAANVVSLDQTPRNLLVEMLAIAAASKAGSHRKWLDSLASTCHGVDAESVTQRRKLIEMLAKNEY